TESKAEEAGSRVILVNPGESRLSNVPGVVCMIVAKTLSDRAQSCPHWGLAMDRDQNAGVQHYEIGAATSKGVVSRDAPDERRESSHIARRSFPATIAFGEIRTAPTRIENLSRACF
ncbi:MAG: hypothetical protein WAO36_04030, partial [Candidatus Methanoculleus thermohydrogenotrophicum]